MWVGMSYKFHPYFEQITSLLLFYHYVLRKKSVMYSKYTFLPHCSFKKIHTEHGCFSSQLDITAREIAIPTALAGLVFLSFFEENRSSDFTLPVRP